MLPVRRPPAGQILYERRNGQFILQVTGHPQFGLPFGQDRLVPIFLATLAVRQQSQTVRFQSAAELLDTFGMAKGGKEYRRLVAAFERIFARLEETFRWTFPQLHDVSFEHRWGGPIAVLARFIPASGWLEGHRIAYGFGYNGQVPGPIIEARQGVPLEIAFTNNLPEPTLIHWHGLQIPAAMDGTQATQRPVPAVRRMRKSSASCCSPG